MNAFRISRSRRRSVRRILRIAIMVVLWAWILHTWFRGPFGRPVRNAQAWEWPVSTPEAEGMDPEKLERLVRHIRDEACCPGLQALLIARNGRLVTEAYFAGWGPELLHTLQSVTKSFTSALVGIALSRGEFKSVEERVVDFFPTGQTIASLDERKASLKLVDLLTMRTGVDYHESGFFSPHAWLNLMQWGQDTWYLRRPMYAPPGTEFRYDSGGAVLFSSLLKRRTGSHAKAYANRYLFAPLGIRRQSWRSNLSGHTHTGGGLSLTARDAAKLGQLYLQGGRWGDRQVVPEAWVRESLQQHVSFAPEGRGVIGYGYFWWILSDGVYAAIGRWGQYVFIVPQYDLVVTVLAMPWPGSDANKPIQFLYDRILPAVQQAGEPAPASGSVPPATPAAGSSAADTIHPR